MTGITVYGADWCEMTTSTREHLDELGVDYKYVDIDNDPQAAKWVRDQNDGKEKKPTLDIDGTVLSTPSDEELDAALKSAGVKISA